MSPFAQLRRHVPVLLRYGLAALCLGRALYALTRLRIGQALRLARLALRLTRSGQDIPPALDEIATVAAERTRMPRLGTYLARRIADRTEADLAPFAQSLAAEEARRAQTLGSAQTWASPALAHPLVGRWGPIALVLGLGAFAALLGPEAPPLRQLSTPGPLGASDLRAFCVTAGAAVAVHVFLRLRARALVALQPPPAQPTPGPGPQG